MCYEETVMQSWCPILRVWETSGQVGVKNRVQTSGPSAFTVDLDLIPDFFPQALMKVKVIFSPGGPSAGSPETVQHLAKCGRPLPPRPPLLS